MLFSSIALLSPELLNGNSYMQLRFVSAGQVSSCAACSRLSDFDPLRIQVIFSATPTVRTTTKARQDEMCEIVCRAAVGVATKESSPPV